MVKKKYPKKPIKYTPAERAFIKKYLPPSAVRNVRGEGSPFGKVLRSRFWLGHNAKLKFRR